MGRGRGTETEEPRLIIRSRGRGGYGLHVRWVAGRFNPSMGVPGYSGLTRSGAIAANARAQSID